MLSMNKEHQLENRDKYLKLVRMHDQQKLFTSFHSIKDERGKHSEQDALLYYTIYANSKWKRRNENYIEMLATKFIFKSKIISEDNDSEKYR
jgi:hypothetical protein